MPPNGWIKANNKIIANNTKKTKLKINKYKVICFGDKNGENAISNDVVASLGKAKNGPITRYKAIVKM